MRRRPLLLAVMLAACSDVPTAAPDSGDSDPDAASLADAELDDSGPTDADVFDGGEPIDLGRPDSGFDAAISVDLGIDAGPAPDAGPGPDAEPGSELGIDAGPEEDFTLPGSYSVESLDFITSMIPVSCRAPVGRTDAPVVLMSHGFFIGADEYLELAGHLATWGLLACSVDYAESLSGNHARSAAEIRDVFDAVRGGSVAALAGRIDTSQVGLLGHSLGGKLSFLVALERPDAAAVVGFDPVDSSPALCSAQNCPSAIDQLPVSMPVLLLGETTDEVRTSVIAPACNPAAENFDDFYAASGANTLEVVLTGASHMSFVDDIAACGAVCSACQPETGPRGDVLASIRWFTTAFLLQNLDDRIDLAPALNGAEATRRFVDTGQVSLRSK